MKGYPEVGGARDRFCRFRFLLYIISNTHTHMNSMTPAFIIPTGQGLEAVGYFPLQSPIINKKERR